MNTFEDFFPNHGVMNRKNQSLKPNASFLFRNSPLPKIIYCWPFDLLGFLLAIPNRWKVRGSTATANRLTSTPGPARTIESGQGGNDQISDTGPPTWAYLSTTPSPMFRSVPAVQLPPSCCCDSTIRSSTLALSLCRCRCASTADTRDRPPPRPPPPPPPPPGSCNSLSSSVAVAVGKRVAFNVGDDGGGGDGGGGGGDSPCCCCAHLAILDRPCRTVTAMALSAHMDTTVATSMAVSAGRGGAGGGGGAGDGAGGGESRRRRSIGPAGRGRPSSARGRGDACTG